MSNTSTRDTIAPAYLAVEDAATFTSLSESTIRGLLRKGLLRRFKVGARTLVSASDLQAFIERSAEPRASKTTTAN